MMRNWITCKTAMLLSAFLWLTVAAEIKIVPVNEIPGEGLTPQQITERVQKSLDKVKAASVAVNSGGYASGVIISKDGFVLTAAHVAKRMKPKKAHIVLSDGRKADVEVLGYNESSDFALLKIKDSSIEWPFVEIADKVPANTSMCFTYAHPSGMQKDRPAQLRIGRITSRTLKEEKTHIIQADLNIQPGDSGGPLFDVNGRLIGLNSSAAGFVGFNRFASIDMFHLDWERLKNADKWGNMQEGPVASPGELKVGKEETQVLMKEFQKRIQDKHRPMSDFVRIKAAGTGKLNVTVQDIVNILGKDVYPLMQKESLNYGMDDPALIAKLPKLPEGFVKPYPVSFEKKVFTYGVPVSENHLLVKLSEIKDKEGLQIVTGKVTIDLVPDGEDKKWDLALLKIEGKGRFKPLKWPANTAFIQAGTGLLCPDIYGRLSWGVASDERRLISKKRSVGPLRDKSLISSFRAPYPSIIRHDLPLFAKEAGTPVYDFSGNLIGIHMGRISRTTGLILDINDVKKAVDKMMVVELIIQ